MLQRIAGRCEATAQYPFRSSFCEQCVENCSRYNGCDRYIAKTFKPIKVPVARPVRKQSGIADFVCSSLHYFMQGFFYPVFN